MTISMVAALLGANLILQKTLPHRTGEDVSIGAGISLSMQCVLRCGTKMYEIDCTTPEGTKIIEGSLCRDIVVGLVDLGEPMAKYSDLEGIFRQNGLKNSIVWFFKAPLTYVTDIHSVEVGLFAFGEQEDAVLRYPFVKDHYGKYFDANRQSLDASPTFALLQQFITVLFHWYVYHVLTVVLLILCSIILFKSRNDHASLFAAYAIGTYLLFSYFNPHVPYRYLMQIISPAFLALVLYLYEKMTEDAQLIRNSP
jgi:hypothetical protein